MTGAGSGRREFLGGTAAVLAGMGLPAGAFAGRAPAGPTIDECDRADVALLDSPAKAQADRTLAALIDMDEADLIRPFRQAAGLPVGDKGLGGWYDASPDFIPGPNMHGFIPGHSFGQYLSALSRGYAMSGDARAKAKVSRLVAAYAPTIGSDFYKDYTLPAYTYDKTLIGLLDAYAFTGNRQALGLIDRETDRALPHLPAKAQDRQLVKVKPGRNAATGWDESYTLAENLYLAADRGAGARYRTLARNYLLDDTYFAPLAAGRNVLPGRHAYSHVNALASAMRAYLTDGNPMHLAAARNGMDMVIAQSFATGGWGPFESFIEPGSNGLAWSLSSSHNHFEAPCGTYGHFKVARYLIRATGESRHGDAMERLFYNAALGALPLKADGRAFYYADYNEQGGKTYFEYACPCCSGSIGQLTADYAISAFLRDDAGLFVNLYTPSRATWRKGGGPALTLTQSGSYPLGPDVAMTVAVPRPVTMALRLRIPAWAGPGTTLAVNGIPVGGVVPGRFATIAREWRDGDRVALRIDRPLRAEPVDAGTPNRVAMMQGPLALFATGEQFTPLTRSQLMSLRQTAPGGAEWQLTGDYGPQTFRPWWTIGQEQTRLYQFLI